nr:carbohydrate-binding domain-containing protein [uncultured Mucilaginibacter sp.]
MSKLSFCLSTTFTVLLFTALISCKKSDPGVDPPPPVATTAVIDSTGITKGAVEGSVAIGAEVDDLIENFTFNKTVSINFSGVTATITNGVAGVTITPTGADLVIRSTVDNVEYVVTGTTTNGSLRIYSDFRFKLTLNNASITNDNAPAINIQSEKTAFIVLAPGTTNTLVDGATYVKVGTEDMKGTIFSEGQLVFSGTGSVQITGNNKHGIVSDDHIRVRSGNITIANAKSDGIHANDYFVADGGVIKITCKDDGLQVEEGFAIFNNGNTTINADDKGITLDYVGTDPLIIPYANINGGALTITSVGEALESKAAITINKGDIKLTSQDDDINAATGVFINGGSIYAISSANDAVDSNGGFTMTGGKLVALGSIAPEGGIDCDAHVLKITGGILVATGGTTSAPSPTVSTIRTLVMGGAAANQIIHIESADGVEALTFQAPKAYATLLYASAKLKAGTVYNVYTEGSVSSGVNFNGLFMSGTYTKGTKTSTSFTTTTIVTQSGGTVSAG